MAPPLAQISHRSASLILLALPLIASMGANSLMQFTDRVFLARLGAEALAAGFPAGMAAWLFQCFFVTCASYASAFAAQHLGAGETDEVGGMVWPALLIAAIGGVCGLALIPILPWLLRPFASDAQVLVPLIELAQWYFAATGFAACTAAVCGFFSGIGRTGVVLALNIGQCVLNAGLNAVLIFGFAGIPALGVRGAGLGTAIALGLTACIALGLILSQRMHREFATRRIRLEAQRLRRFLRFAAPHGVRMLIEMLVWGWFTIAVARLGTTALAANNIVINWNLLTFLPMMGLAQAVAIAAGQAQGSGNVDEVRRVVRHGMHLMLAYAAVVGVVIIVFDTALIAAFIDHEAADQDRIVSLASQLLVIAALWGVGDAINLTCTHALNGVGDTRWTLIANAITGILVLALPTLLVLYRYEQGTMPGEPVVVLWSITLAFIAVIAAVTAWRFAGRRWEDSTVRA